MDIEQIRRSHANARPKQANPAWCNTHHDLGFVLARNELLERVLEAARPMNIHFITTKEMRELTEVIAACGDE